MNKNLTATQRTAQIAKMSRQWKWLQEQRKNATVSGAVITRP